MYTESVLLESRSARSGLTHRVEVLDKVKVLALSQGAVRATTQQVADYFEVPLNAVEKLVSRHRSELESNGFTVLRGSDLRRYETDNVSVSSGGAESYPQRRNSVAVFDRRAVLTVAMLLRDSAVAQRVRAYLLDVEQATQSGALHELRQTVRTLASGYTSVDLRVSGLESAVGDIGNALRELGPVIGRMSVRLERIDRGLEEETGHRLARTEEIVRAMSARLADVREEMRGLRGDLRRGLRTGDAGAVQHQDGE